MNTVNPLFSAHIGPPSLRRANQLLSLSGELDAAAHETLCHAAAQAGEHDLIIDLSRVTFMDATGLRCLLNLRHSRLGNGRTVTLCGASPGVQKLFSLVGLDSLLIDPPPPDPAATGQQSEATSAQTRVGPVSARTHTGRLLWQSRLFTISASICFEPRAVYATATGDFSTPAATTVLQGALTRLARFHAPVQINSDGVTKASSLASGILQAHRHTRHLDPGTGMSRPAKTPVAGSATTPQAA